MITGLDAYCIFNTVKTHFSSNSFQIEKYGYRTKRFRNPQKFETNRFRFFFEKLAKQFHTQDELASYLASSMIWNCDMWIGDALTEENEKNFKRWKRFTSAMKYYIIKDMKELIEKHEGFRVLFESSRDDDIPPILHALIDRSIHPETIVTLNRVFPILNILDNKLGDNHILWSPMRKSLEKYQTFLPIQSTEQLTEIRNELHDLIEETTINSI